MNKLIPVLLALALVGCDDNKQPQTPISRGGWFIQHSVGMPPTMVDTIDLPKQPNQIDYVTRACTSGGNSIHMEYRIEGDGKLVPTEGDPPPLVRLILQRRGDDLTLKRGPSYRFWSPPGQLSPGTHVLDVQINPGLWTNVNGLHDEAGFRALIGDCGNEGFTFGGMFAGHGVWIVDGGNVKFTLVKYERR